ncbi:flagellar basal body rod C-terminal domain-containing protein, partial [Campylobacter lanienae]
GDNLYKIDNMEEVVDNATSGSIAQGYAQISNVNPVKEMVSLIETQRMVDMYQRVMTTHMSDLNQEAINKLASMRAN